MRRPLIVLVAAIAALVSIGALPAAAADTSLSKIDVAGANGQKPTLDFPQPFTAGASAHRVVTKGSGEKLVKGAKVTVDYVLIDGRNGQELEASYGKTPVALDLDVKKAAPVLVDSLLGEKVGTRVLVAIAPKEGLTRNTTLQGAGVKKNDTLIFLLDVKDLHNPLARAKGAKITPPLGLPTVALGRNGKPTVTVPTTDAPTNLVVQPLIKGAGAAVAAGQTITVHYTALIWQGGKKFDSSWDRNQPSEFTIGTGQVIPGWDAGLVGQTVGSQVLLVIPPDQGYGAGGNPQAGIKGTDTLVFVVDILDAA
jgi:FKBP-type peptidyl-prolyl cis-trans isomerase